VVENLSLHSKAERVRARARCAQTVRYQIGLIAIRKLIELWSNQDQKST